jgi:hypothetical protein
LIHDSLPDTTSNNGLRGAAILAAWFGAVLSCSRCLSIQTLSSRRYKKDVDRTLLRENLKLSVDHRVRKMISALRFADPSTWRWPRPSTVFSSPATARSPERQGRRASRTHHTTLVNSRFTA